ncbi:MAG: type II toxin-antitoxin system prevent-host-death family antitoxin [Parvibaculaceae bacterium]
MRSYTLTELGNKSGEVTEAAFRGPVDIISRGKRKFVLLTAEDYDQLTQERPSQRAVHVDDLNHDEAGDYIAGLSAPIKDSLDD